jgi:hypothetical protein
MECQKVSMVCKVNKWEEKHLYVANGKKNTYMWKDLTRGLQINPVMTTVHVLEEDPNVTKLHQFMFKRHQLCYAISLIRIF